MLGRIFPQYLKISPFPQKIQLNLKARNWWIGITVILLVAASFRFSGYTFGLPYLENHDEPWFFYEAAFQRGLLSWWDHPNPSQGLIVIYTVAQVGWEHLSGQSALNQPTPIFVTMRFVSVVASLVTIIFISLCARELAGDFAGWLAAGLWAIIPLVIYHSFVALAEPWMMLFGALALYLAVLAFKYRSPQYALLSVYAGLIAFTFKYSMFSFAGIGLVASIWLLWSNWSHIEQRWCWLRLIVAELISIALFLAAMVLIGGMGRDISSPSREVAQFLQNPLKAFTDIQLMLHVVESAFVQLGTTPIVYAALYIAALVAIYGQTRQEMSLRQNWYVAIWLLFGALGVFNMLLVTLYLLYEGTLLRYLFSADLVFGVLAASASVIVVNAVLRRFRRKSQRTLFSIFSIGTIIALIVWLLPLILQSLSDAIERTKPYTLTDLTVWASNSLGEGNVLTDLLGYHAFAREFGGYSGLKRAAQYGPDPLSKSPEQWRQEGYRFLQVTADMDQQVRQSETGAAYMEKLLKLRQFPAPESAQHWTGPAFIVYQLQRPQQSLNLQFGDAIDLVGIDGLESVVHAGDTVSLRFYWQAVKLPQDNYSLFVHLTPHDKRTQLIAQADGAPAALRRPTLTWNIPSETLVSEPFTVTIPKDAVGNYDLWIGLYDPTNGQRLWTKTGSDWLLTTFAITP